jgi:Sigma-70, region 4
MVDFMDEENAEMLAEEELRKLYAAMGKLTDRQQEIIQLYFYKGLNQYEIAEELGIVRPVVSKIMAAAIKRLKKSF